MYVPESDNRNISTLNNIPNVKELKNILKSQSKFAHFVDSGQRLTFRVVPAKKNT